ncbi:MAG: peptidoglycan bridge formation glycyltransferase FemA/FemB family protein [Patescibacteria group bacterium]
MLKVIEIKTQEEKNIFEKFLKENQASFLQSLEWGEFQAATGKRVWNLAAVDDEKFIASAQIIRHKLLFGKCYLYCPRGPVVKIPNSKFQIPNKFQNPNFKIQNIFKLLIEYIKTLAQKEKAIFFRVEPEFLVQDKEKLEVLKNLGFKKSVHELQPKDTLVLDLSKTEEELLKEMHYKTRYNIRLAEKRGVKVRQSVEQKDLEFFYQLLKKIALRDKFSPHLKEYYQKQIEILGPKNLIKLFLAEYQGEIIAGILVSFYGDRAVYMHGAHNENFKNLMAPHLLQWSAILKAKHRGCKIYDFWGIAPKAAPASHPWQGITRFKRGFGGREINYVGAWDLVFSKFWYWGYNLSHRLRNF